MNVVVSGSFDDMRSRQLRFLEEASRLGPLTVLLWPDVTVRKITGKSPKFPFAEREYFLNSVRFANRVMLFASQTNADELPPLPDLAGAVWADEESSANQRRKEFSAKHGLAYRVFGEDELKGFPELPAPTSAAGRKRVLVTGCYDWFHSGHVRFFEDVSAYGDLYVVAGSDANVKLLKGPHHPMHSQDERRYVISAIRFVKQVLVSTGEGWLDAGPEIARIKPDIYAVNEDGDKGGKREFCEQRGIEYLVLKRTPAPGLPKRSSTELRGF